MCLLAGSMWPGQATRGTRTRARTHTHTYIYIYIYYSMLLGDVRCLYHVLLCCYVIFKVFISCTGVLLCDIPGVYILYWCAVL